MARLGPTEEMRALLLAAEPIAVKTIKRTRDISDTRCVMLAFTYGRSDVHHAPVMTALVEKLQNVQLITDRTLSMLLRSFTYVKHYHPVLQVCTVS